MDILAIKGTVTDLKGPIADQLNALGKELFDGWVLIGVETPYFLITGQIKLVIDALDKSFSYWLAMQALADPLDDDSIDPESDDINTHMLLTQFMRIEQQIAIYYQAACKMLVEKGLKAEALSLPMPPCIFPDDAGPDNWEYWTEEEMFAQRR